jgi:hypothetical protein
VEDIATVEVGLEHIEAQHIGMSWMPALLTEAKPLSEVSREIR